MVEKWWKNGGNMVEKWWKNGVMPNGVMARRFFFLFFFGKLQIFADFLKFRCSLRSSNRFLNASRSCVKASFWKSNKD